MASDFDGLRVVSFEGRRSERITALIERLGGRIVTVMPGSVLPSACGLSGRTVQAVIQGQADAILFIAPRQVVQAFSTARNMDVEMEFRQALKGVVIASGGPQTSQALWDRGFRRDFEPDRPKLQSLIYGLARSARQLIRRKRASLIAGVDTSQSRRIDLVWPTCFSGRCGCDPLHHSAFLRACRREKAEHTPIWLMRQAGRYQREYREIRARTSFLEMCKRPELAAEVTVMAVEQLGVDAAIIFADILLIIEPMGVELRFSEGHGPEIPRPVRTNDDVDALQEVEPRESLAFVNEAIRMARRALPPAVPLIGFCGAPFTVASYLIEGKSSRDFRQTKMFMYRDPGAWYALMDKLVFAHAKYLNSQIEAGVQAVQLFDSWVGCLNETDYREYVLPHTQTLMRAIKPGVPIIHFGTNTATLLKSIKESGGDVIGLDWRVNLAKTWAELGYNVAIQGNLDPTVLFAPPSIIRRHAKAILDQAEGRPGHIFNLGHGILPETPVDHVIALVDAVHEYSR